MVSPIDDKGDSNEASTVRRKLGSSGKGRAAAGGTDWRVDAVDASDSDWR